MRVEAAPQPAGVGRRQVAVDLLLGGGSLAVVVKARDDERGRVSDLRRRSRPSRAPFLLIFAALECSWCPLEST